MPTPYQIDQQRKARTNKRSRYYGFARRSLAELESDIYELEQALNIQIGWSSNPDKRKTVAEMLLDRNGVHPREDDIDRVFQGMEGNARPRLDCLRRQRFAMLHPRAEFTLRRPKGLPVKPVFDDEHEMLYILTYT